MLKIRMHQGTYRTVILFLLLAASPFFVRCATDKVALELAHYVNQDILAISELEKKSLQKYALVTGANYTSDEELYKTLKQDVVPVYGRFLTKLRDMSPQEPEIKKLHKFYLRGAELIHGGFKTKIFGLETRDGHLIRNAKEKIEKGRLETERWRKELNLLAETHGIKERK